MTEVLAHVEDGNVLQAQHQEVAAAVVHLANLDGGVHAAEAVEAPKIEWPTPKYFTDRDHTNPFTMDLPAQWGHTRPSKSRTLND